MSCEQQPSSGDCADVSIDYAVTPPRYSVELDVLGQNGNREGEPSTLLYGAGLIRAEDGLRAPEARPASVPIEVFQEGQGSGLPVVNRTDPEDALEVSFEVCNPSCAHSMLGMAVATLTFNYRLEFEGLAVLLVAYALNLDNHEGIYLPLPMRYEAAGEITTAGISVGMPLAPRDPIAPGECWADTVRWQVYGSTDTPTVEIFDWTAEIEGMLY